MGRRAKACLTMTSALRTVGHHLLFPAPKRPSMFRSILATLGVAFALFAAASPAQAFGWHKEVRACDNPRVLKRIMSRFEYQVRHVPHLPDVRITGFDRIHQHRFIPAGEKRPIARRYCMATATLSDGRQRSVWYLIESDMGFASLGSGVEFCVSGFDRWNVYNNSCRILR